jgi:ABC-2 type transport system ATP-binding protein
MNILTGCLAATEGEVKIGGYDIFDEADKAKRLIGYLPEQPPLYMDMTPDEYLLFVARARGLSGARAAERLGASGPSPESRKFRGG